jgi:citrate lyase subunit beta/citryl-CoA lyase
VAEQGRPAGASNSLMVDDQSVVVRRSCLSVPAGSEPMLRKSTTVPADEIVLDLEDSVAQASKSDALRAVTRKLEMWDGPRVSVRINAPRTRWCHRELIALATSSERLDSVVVPKVEGVGDIAFVDRLLDGVEAESGRACPIRIQALVESATGLKALPEIASASPRLDTLILGYADLSTSLGRPLSSLKRLDLWLAAQEALLWASRSSGLQAIDGPFLGADDGEEFQAAARRARDLGFDGKWVLHPRQIGAINSLFTPCAEEVEHAHRVIESLDLAARTRGAGVTALDGNMLDEAVRKAAERVLARAGIRR